MGSAIFQYMEGVSVENYKKEFYYWMKRLKFVLQHKGDYFEKLHLWPQN